jgi:hypothetical protein
MPIGQKQKEPQKDAVKTKRVDSASRVLNPEDRTQIQL